MVRPYGVTYSYILTTMPDFHKMCRAHGISLLSIICIAFTSQTIAQTPLDIPTIERVLGQKGKENKGEYKITIPQNDLDLRVDGFRIIPPMGLSSWVAFTPSPSGAMVMGDLVLTENDLKPVQAEVVRQGLDITAIHNHFVRNHPNIVYMHIGGAGPVPDMAGKIKAVLGAINTSRGHVPSSMMADSVVSTLNAADLDLILGQKGEWSKGVYKYTIGRPDIHLTEHGVAVSTFLGFNTWAAWQGSGTRGCGRGFHDAGGRSSGCDPSPGLPWH